MNDSKTKAIETPGTSLTLLARSSDPSLSLWMHLGRRSDLEGVWSILERAEKREPVIVSDSAHARRSILEALVRESAHPGYLPSTISRCALPVDSIEIVALGKPADAKAAAKVAETLFASPVPRQKVLHVDAGLLPAPAREILHALVPFLGENGIRCVAVMTSKQYQELIVADEVLGRLFRAFHPAPYGVSDTVAALTRILDRFQAYHHVHVRDGVLEATAEVAARRGAVGSLPESAIDLLEEVVAWAKLRRNESLSLDEWQLDREIQRLQSENEAAMTAGDFTQAAARREEADRIKKRKSEMIRARASAANDEEIDLPLFQSALRDLHGNALSFIDGGLLKIVDWEARLRERIKGRDRAIEQLGQALRARAAGIGDPHRPVGCFLFAGLAGTGKSALAEALSEVVSGGKGGKGGLLRLDLAEYQDRESLSRLSLDWTNGFAGRPPEVLLLERADRAHPESLDRILGLMEAKGNRGPDCRDTLLILTLTVGEDVIPARPSFGFDVRETPFQEREAIERLKQAFERTSRPDFWKRLEIVAFGPLGDAAIEEILDLELAKVASRARERDVQLVVTDAARKWLTRESKDPSQGARPLLRAVETQLIQPLAECILRGDSAGWPKVVADFESDRARIVFRRSTEGESASA